MRFNTLRNRLVLLIFAITAAAVLFVYLYVVPQLESSLTAEKLRRLDQQGTEQSPTLKKALRDGETQRELRRLVRRIGQSTDSRVTLLAVEGSGGDSKPGFVIADSEAESSAVLPDYDAAAEAVVLNSSASGVESVSGERIGESALPIGTGAADPSWVAVLSSPLNDVTDNVALIRRQIVIAGLIALLASLIAGFYAARAISRRIGRLQIAAEKVAEGNFSEPIPIDSSDELGQLAQTFNEMQQRLARLDSARKEFIANASHELRTPIFSLGGFVELLEHEDPDPESRRQFVETMREQIERLQKLTTDLLDLSRLDADAMEIHLERVDLVELARTIAGEFRPAARRHRSSLELRSADQPVFATCDPDRVGQIIRILLDNAIIHTARGTKVTMTAVDSNGSAELIVGDDGRGIDRRSLGRVFDRFYSGDDASGSGLGLAIADELATRMKGELTAVSERGFTAFTLRLPLAAGAAVRETAQAGTPT